MDSIGIFGVIAYVATLVLFWEVARYYFVKSNHRYKSKNNLPVLKDENDYVTDLIEIFYQMTVLIWMVMPLTLFDTNFFRLQRPMWLMLYIVGTSMMENGYKNIRLGNLPSINMKYFSFCVSIMGFVFYICVFSFNVVNAFLL